ncbi:aerobic-type carbon monoxide dehydrogenase, middle subunit CoxM/CutM-like protein [Desulfosporosinus orientis DSM 765]|uniref:Aerobic-type carbon monoxide dehydrogenase, middle subunit CoxM/CutM-like protein n=1 Tax=Desulfosporosinus orientis (strain ATCC 19365 / DSM 765 / NCIMB 8382 / VKM B-1628 / Singapore I) TaxID=768706 RepID=G7W8A1_DESOD|nr:FAD binding domain-containing protein [Desulfosporosinus orientis]AET67041.1 aerobic-type carbon monoxide dehydrogenase, middle subunit CoxM/CutM-like protein [Desulfosporosinus orientis DSM 765]
MKYFQPNSVEEAIEMAQTYDAAFLAGGTDLVLHMRTGKVQPSGLIDLGKIPVLREIKEDNGYLKIGSMATFEVLGNSEMVFQKAHALWQACQSMGSPQIRNQATLGGNLGNCSPAADGLPPLLALGAEVKLISPEGEEIVPLSTLLNRHPLLANKVLIREFRIPLKGMQSGFAKLGRRRALAIARLSVAMAVKMKGSRTEEVQVALGAVGRRAFLSESLGMALSGQAFNEIWLEKGVSEVQRIVREALGTRASAPYKRVAVAGVFREASVSIIPQGGRQA